MPKHSRHTETALDSIKYNKVYLEPRIEGNPLLLSNLLRPSRSDQWFATFKKTFLPYLRIFEKNHKFGAYADIQCIGKLAKILSDLLTAVVEYHPVPKRATGTNSLPRHQLCDFPSCEKDLCTRIKIMLYP